MVSGKTKPSRKKDVLRYKIGKRNNKTVRRAYGKYRQDLGVPEQCDISTCLFHTSPLEWNGKPLKLILDHVDGNSNNNAAYNLRLLCPNCDSQQDTHGGRNRGLIQNQTALGYQKAYRNSSRLDATVCPDAIPLTATLVDPTVKVNDD